MVWQLTLLTVAIVPLIAVAGGAYTILMSTLSKKGEDAYAEAGKLAEEVMQMTFPSHCQHCCVSFLVFESRQVLVQLKISCICMHACM